jgi:hypothetical protein
MRALTTSSDCVLLDPLLSTSPFCFFFLSVFCATVRGLLRIGLYARD